MDVYIIICFFAVFAALVEFACINFIDTFIKRFKAWEEEERLRKEKEAELEESPEEKEDKDADTEEDGETKTDGFFDELLVVHPSNGKEAISYSSTNAAEMFFIDHR